MIVITAFISPYREDRDQVRQIMAPGDFIEVYIDTPIEVCEARDPKGLYRKARAGQIAEFTGVSAPYEAPLAAELVVRTPDRTVDACAQEIIDHLVSRGYLKEG